MIRMIHGFLIMLITAAVEILIYFTMSPVFYIVQNMLPESNMYLTPFLRSQLDFALGSYWVWFVLFVVIYVVILTFVQAFIKEQREAYY